MAAEPLAAPPAFTDSAREELARRLWRLLYHRWLSERAEGRAPIPSDARPRQAGREGGGNHTDAPTGILRP